MKTLAVDRSAACSVPALVLAVRHFGCRIQFWNGRRLFEQAKIRHAPHELSAAFRRVGLEVDFALSFS